MSLFNVPVSECNSRPDWIFDELPELKRKVIEYIDRPNISEWSYRFNRIFISPANSFNTKYLIEYLTSKLAKQYKHSRTQVLSTSSNDNQLISQTERFEIEDDEKPIIEDILEKLTDQEFFRLLQIEPEKRIETLMYQYHAFSKTLEDLTFDKLCKLNIDSLHAEVPYEIYTEALDDKVMNTRNDAVNSATVKGGDLLKLIKTCGTIVIDVSRDIEALTNGKKLFKSFKKEILSVQGKNNGALDMKNKRLIVVVSTVMTWAGTDKRRAVSESDVRNRKPSPEFMNHYEFELEVLGVNQTKKLKEIIKTIVVWSGLTYGFEQDLLKFAFDSACKNTNIFPIPKSQNHLPVVHVGNLARLIYKIISETPKLKNNYIFAVENPTNTLKHMISALGKTCEVGNPTYVSLDTFVDGYKLTDFHKQTVSVDTEVYSSVDRLWPDFEWYDDCKSLMAYKIKSLVETYKMEHNIKNIVKLLVLGPPASGKTKLASRLAEYYNSRYLEPREITQNHIDCIVSHIVTHSGVARNFALGAKQFMLLRGELIQLRQTNHSTYSVDSSDDSTAEVNGTDPSKVKRLQELEQKLEKMYSSLDTNNGVLEDNYLIPLLNEQILNSFSLKRGYVLDGYPITKEQGKKLFSDTDSLQNVNKWPDLTVCLKKIPQCNLSKHLDIDTVEIIPTETKHMKKRLAFSEVNPSSDLMSVFKPNLSVQAAKSILKKSTNSSSNNKQFTGKPDSLVWNQHNYNNLLTMLNSHYVQMMTIDSPYSPLPLEFNVNKVDLPKTDPTFDQLLNVVVQEIDWGQNHSLLKNLEKTNSITTKIKVQENDDKQKGEELIKKMTLLEEFENIITNFEHIENLSAEKYLIKYVTPTLLELITKVAKVRPKNPVEFLAAMALKKNPEGLFDCPGYSKKGEEIQTLLECMFQNMDIHDTETTFDSKPLMKFLSTHGDDKSVISQE